MPEPWLYRPESLAAVLLSKCLGFPSPPSVTQAQKPESGPEMLGQRPTAVAVMLTGRQRMPVPMAPRLGVGAWSCLLTPSLPGPSIRPVFLAWRVDLLERETWGLIGDARL